VKLIKNINGPAAILLCAILLLAVIVLFWQADRGLGLADEGIYILASRYPSEVQQNVSAIYTFVGGTFELVGYNLAALRSIWIVMMLLSAAILWFGFYKVLTQVYEQATRIRYIRLISLMFIAAGTLLHYQWSYLTPSYYTLTALSVNVFAGLVLTSLVFSADEWKLGRAYLSSAAAGVVLGETLFFKFPTAIIIAILAVFLLGLWRGPSRGVKGRLFISAAVGFGAWLALYHFLIQRLDQAWRMFQEGWVLYQTLGLHSPAEKVLAYPIEIGVLLYTGFFEFLPCYFLLAGAYLIRWCRPSTANPQAALLATKWLVIGALAIAFLISAVGGIWVASAERFNAAPVGGRTLPYLGFEIAWMLLLSAIWVVVYRRPQERAPRLGNLYLVILVLLAMPFAGAAGTSNPIYNVILFYAAPWFCAILMLLVGMHYANPKVVAPAVLPLAALVIGAYACSHVIQGSIYQPAQIKPRTMLEQTVATQVGDPPVVLKLDPATHELVTKLSAAAQSLGFVAGGDIIAFDEQPALVYALGGRSPGHPAFPCCRSEGRNSYSKMALTFAEPERLKKSFVLLSVEQSTQVAEILGSAGLRFPQNYYPPVTVVQAGHEYSLYKPLD